MLERQTAEYDTQGEWTELAHLKTPPDEPEQDEYAGPALKRIG